MGKWWLLAFPSFPILFKKDLFLRVVKNLDCVLKGQEKKEMVKNTVRKGELMVTSIF